MTYYPIIIPTLNRYSHFKRCVESLIACTHADKTELVIGFDYPPSEKYVEGWKKIKEYIPQITGFKKITVFNREYNFGAVKNSNDLREYAYKNYDAYIFTEDDNVFSPCFLDYINKGLEKYKNDKNVIAISGYMIPINFSKSESNIIYVKDYPAWGIGIWKNRMDEIKSNIILPYRKYVLKNKKLLQKIQQYPHQLYQLYFWIKNNPSLDRPCDFVIANYLCLSDKWVICPRKSLSKNTGYDGSGINCGSIQNNFYTNQKILKNKKFTIIDKITEEEKNDLNNFWEEERSKLIASSFSEKNKKEIIDISRKYLTYGYFFTEKILFSLLPRIKKIIKSIFRLLYHFAKKIYYKFL